MSLRSAPLSPDTSRVAGLLLRDLPKVSLHDHLDGGLRPQTVIDLAADADVELPADDASGLEAWIDERSTSGSLEEYLTSFELTGQVLQTAEGLQRVAEEYVEDLAADGVVYGEVRWAPELHLGGGLSLDEAVQAVQAGLEAGEDAVEDAGGDIRVSQILSAMRQGNRVRDIAELAVSFRHDGVVAFDIAGPEDGYPPSDFVTTFDYLAEEFFPVTVHAGEGAGLDSVRSALLDGRALRLGHGVAVAQDVEVLGRDGADVQVRLGDLARWVRDREVPLEVSPTSNRHTGAFAAWGDLLEDHPFDLLYQLGFCVTVNTDNRLVSATTLTRELAALVAAFDYDLGDLEQFQLNAAAATFLPVDEREDLIDVITEGFAR